jgi:hypothetical protein
MGSRSFKQRIADKKGPFLIWYQDADNLNAMRVCSESTNKK